MRAHARAHSFRLTLFELTRALLTDRGRLLQPCGRGVRHNSLFLSAFPRRAACQLLSDSARCRGQGRARSTWICRSTERILRRSIGGWRVRGRSLSGPRRRPARTCVSPISTTGRSFLQAGRISLRCVVLPPSLAGSLARWLASWLRACVPACLPACLPHCGTRSRSQHRWDGRTPKWSPTMRRRSRPSPPPPPPLTPSCWWTTCTQRSTASAARTVRLFIPLLHPMLPVFPPGPCQIDRDKAYS